MDEEETKTCPNCKREIPAVNFTIHSVHCARNIKICPVCKEPVPGPELQDHHEKMHKLLPCKQCGESVCGTDLEDHVRDSCAHTVKSCRYCELELPRRELPTHEGYCGVRTDQCPDCMEYVMIKYQQLHVESNHGFIRLDDDPVPVKKETPKIRPLSNLNRSISTSNGPASARPSNVANRPTTSNDSFGNPHPYVRPMSNTPNSAPIRQSPSNVKPDTSIVKRGSSNGQFNSKSTNGQDGYKPRISATLDIALPFHNSPSGPSSSNARSTTTNAKLVNWPTAIPATSNAKPVNWPTAIPTTSNAKPVDWPTAIPATSNATPVVDWTVAIPGTSNATPVVDWTVAIPGTSNATPVVDRTAAIPATSNATHVVDWPAAIPATSNTIPVIDWPTAIPCPPNYLGRLSNNREDSPSSSNNRGELSNAILPSSNADSCPARNETYKRPTNLNLPEYRTKRNVNPGVNGGNAPRTNGVKKRTNDQPQINMDTEATKTVEKDLGAVSRGAVKKRPAPPPPRAPRDLPYYSAAERRQREERERRELNEYNLAHGLPSVLNPVQKLEKLRKIDLLHNREFEEPRNTRREPPPPASPDRGYVLGRDDGARDQFKNLKPMSPTQFMRRFSSMQVSPPAKNGDRFPEIKSSLRELRRGLNEVTAPYNTNNNAAANNNNDRVRSPSPPLPVGEGVQLPCEFCDALIPADDLVQHETGCRPDLARLSAGAAPPPGPDPDPVIPCEFCAQSLPVYAITEHQERCIQNMAV